MSSLQFCSKETVQKRFVTMRSYVLSLALFSVLMWVQAEEELYSDKYDYINVDEILANERLREQYYKCFMDTAPCITPDAIFFKQHMPEAISTKCKKCTKMQSDSFDKIADWYTTNQPEKWTAFVEKTLKDFKNQAQN